MEIFEKDVNEDYSEKVETSIRNLEEFQQHFETVKAHFQQIDELNEKSKLMK